MFSVSKEEKFYVAAPRGWQQIPVTASVRSCGSRKIAEEKFYVAAPRG